MYEETGGAAGDYQPLKRYVEENLPFSRGPGTQAFIKDLINEFHQLRYDDKHFAKQYKENEFIEWIIDYNLQE